MKLKSKVGIFALAAVLSASIFAGCGTGGASSESATPPPSASGSSASQSASPAGDVSLRFSWWGGDARHEATLATIDLYMKKYPNVKIDAEYGGYDGYQQKITTQLAGGTEPDIMQIDQPWMVEFTRQNPDFFVDIAQLGDKLDISGFSKDMLQDFCTYNNKLVGLPTGSSGLTFLANQQVLTAAGVQFGEKITWEDLLEQGKKVNEKNPENYMLNMNNGAVELFIVRSYLYQLMGGPLVKDDYTLAFTKDDLKQAYEYVIKLRDANVLNPYEDAMLFNEDPTQNPKWNNNQIGGWLNWSSTVSMQTWGDNAVILPYPVMDGAKQSGITVRPSQILSVSAKSKNIDEAVKFVNYFFNDDEAIITLKDSRSIPATTHARELLEQNGMANQLSIRAVNVSLKNPGNPETPLSTNSEVIAPIDAAVEKLMYRQSDVDTVVNETVALMEDVLANLKASRG